jgi:hypothetical protein
VCAHVGPLLREESSFLREVGSVAARTVVLVHDAGDGDDKFFFRELYPRLLGWRAPFRKRARVLSWTV